jgi:Integrase zinc binding domain/Integrase core domain
MAAARVQRWAMLLSAYRYTIKYRKGMEIGLPDYLSRNPDKESSQVPEVIAAFREIDEVPLSHREIAKSTQVDPILSKVIQHLQHGWPEKPRDENLQPYYVRRNDFSVGDNCLLWGRRVVVPTVLRNEILKLLHSQHNGIVRMKMLARSCCWWPKIDQDIEKTAKTCQQCACHSRAESKTSFSDWPRARATENFERCHIDFFHLFGQVYFLLIDARSKWIEVEKMSTTTAGDVIGVIRAVLARFGLIVTLVADNGPPFGAEEFTKFLKNNNIRLEHSPPYHPESNGLAKRAMQTCKQHR